MTNPKNRDSLRLNQMPWSPPFPSPTAGMNPNARPSNLNFQYGLTQAIDFSHSSGFNHCYPNQIMHPQSVIRQQKSDDTDTFNPYSPTKVESGNEVEWPLPHPDMARTTDRDGSTPYLRFQDFPKAVQILGNPHADDETLFRDHTMAADFRASLGEGQSMDMTIPRSPREKRVCVKLLFKAFKSVAFATDNAPMLEAFNSEKHNNHKVEAMCWDLLTAMIRRSENGPLLKAYDEKKVVLNPDLPTFASRLDAVVCAMTEQKTICKHLFDAPYINTFVDDPKKASSRVKSNRDLNAKKGVIMTKGKELMEKDQTPHTPVSKRKKSKNNDYSDSEDDTVDISPLDLFTPTPASRVQSSRRTARKTRSAVKQAKIEAEIASSPAEKKARTSNQTDFLGAQQPPMNSMQSTYGNLGVNRTSSTSHLSQYPGHQSGLYGNNAAGLMPGPTYSPFFDRSQLPTFGLSAGLKPFPNQPTAYATQWNGVIRPTSPANNGTQAGRFTYNGRTSSSPTFLDDLDAYTAEHEELEHQMTMAGVRMPGSGVFPKSDNASFAGNDDEEGNGHTASK